ncbi:homeobox and leucine zipper protein Homez [Salmo salar]|uniref:Homeobox and leucine zipper protein Homez n=1 Tax=Salmo salar TaxID=8030 RepID=A0A1S3LZA9_SALSA|nr:homeobox and leucine zipper protein Homez [Salmo salar]XP_045550234.1 homeobox and leucine zipper protein Homez [Salmo salar]XP_045550235.1 homeobox and leucine zipper protein Homez [Salmo salar]|eukprot:XP_013996263.1 PREDICTED: homeobox and leucine zipper protein Homez [Salmo salar]
MATHVDCNRRIGLEVNMKELSQCDVTWTENEGKHASPHSSKTSHYQITNGKSNLSSDPSATDSDVSEGRDGGVSFSTNHNSVVCLPLVSEGLKLVWTQSDQTRELDTIPELVQAFNVFPYPTSREVNALARLCALPLDKVKVWFMVQRIKYGISWASEEIEETRRKLAGPERTNDYANEKEIKMRNGCGAISVEAEDDDQINNGLHSYLLHPRKRARHETPEPCKPAATVQHFSSSLPPPQDSYYYRPPVDMPATTATDASLSLSETSLGSPQQQQRGRYKKTKAQLAVLRSSFLRENWPAETELRRLQEETSLSRNDIRKWFSDSRYQLRNGRGLLGTSMVYPQLTTGDAKNESQQLRPLPLVAHRPRDQEYGVEVQGRAQEKGARSNGVKDSHFFQNFLSNSLEAFGEGAVGVEAEEDEVAEEASVHTETVKEENEGVVKQEKPLHFRGSKNPEVKQPPSAVTISTSSPTSYSTTPSTLTANKRSSTSTSTVQRSARSAKASLTALSLSSPPSSSSPLLTPAGRPRKTKEQLDILKEHFLRCQWPKSEDYTQLVELTGLPRADVSQWFGDTRYAVKNGQLRWVQGVREQFREQFLAELATQQNGSGGNSSSGTPRVTGSRKRKSQVNGATAPTSTADSPDINPLEVYHRSTGVLHEKDLDALCKKSRMSYQQVRDWFASQESKAIDPEPNVTD